MTMQVYFAECGSKIKIGISKNVNSRIAQLQQQAGRPVILLGAIKGDLRIEAAILKKLRSHQIEGEWFKDCREVRAAIQHSISHFPAPSEEAPSDSPLTEICKVLWPKKTAMHLASATGCSARAAEFYLAGRQWSAAALSAVMMEILKRHHMRNVKVIARE